MKLTNKQAKQLALAVSAFIAAWTAAGYAVTSQAIMGSLAAAMTGLMAPQDKPKVK
jgi:hypothetical protein